MAQQYNDCVLCRVMRSMAFTGLGMGIGALAAYLVGASKQNMALTGIVVAAVLILGMAKKERE